MYKKLRQARGESQKSVSNVVVWLSERVSEEVERENQVNMSRMNDEWLEFKKRQDI